MAREEFLSIRVTTEFKAAVTRAANYRHAQLAGTGKLEKPDLSEYIRYLIKEDLVRAESEIRARRQA